MSRLKDKYVGEVAPALMKKFEYKSPMQIPYLEDARTKMASRDLCFREAHHENIAEYISPVQTSDYEKFIGEHSDDFLQDLFDKRDVMKRLK